MEIELINADGITLKTKDKYCSEDSEYENYLKIPILSQKRIKSGMG